MDEIIFLVEDAPEGGFSARALGHSIFTAADTEQKLQAMVKDAAWIITDDTRSFYKFARELTVAGKATFRPIKLEDGFNLAFFDPAGQRQLGFDDEPDESEADE